MDYQRVVLRNLLKNLPPGIPEDQIKEGCVYALNWSGPPGGSPEVVRVISFKDGIVETDEYMTDLETFASRVVAGPYEI